MGVQKHPLEIDWEIDASAILDAIMRSSDLTKRGMRGIIAEAVFVRDVLPSVVAHGWEAVDEGPGNPLYDSLLQRQGRKVRIQVKLQRMEKQVPKLFQPRYYNGELYDVEVQKTRTGHRKKKRSIEVSTSSDPVVETIKELEATRPYRFTDFDILAVNMHPSTRKWTDFRYTVASWLLPKVTNHLEIETHQPVAIKPNEVWTDDLGTCLRWFLSGKKRRVLPEIKHRLPNRKRSKRTAE